MKSEKQNINKKKRVNGAVERERERERESHRCPVL